MKGLLTRRPSYEPENLSCRSSDMWCLPGDQYEPHSPVLIPTHMSSKTVFHCTSENNCIPCVVVKLEVSLTYLTEGMEKLEGEGCDGYDKDDDDEDDEDEEEEEDDEEEEASSDSRYLDTGLHSNDSFICANFFISLNGPHSSSCVMVEVRMPISSIPPSQHTGPVQVGELEYDCFRGHLSEDLIILAYTVPRFHNILQINHSMPGCSDLEDPNKVSPCYVPLMDIIHGKTNTSIGIVNGSRNNTFTLETTYGEQVHWTVRQILNGEERVIVLHEDIVPCMCFKVSWSNVLDALKNPACPFEEALQYEENIWKNSNLTLSLKNSKLLYTLEVWCPVVVEISLCWRNGHQADCHEIPGSKSNIKAQRITEEAKGLHSFQHSICVQVKYKNKTWHTNCTDNIRDFQSSVGKNTFLIAVSNSSHADASFCIVWRNTCLALNSTTLQELHGVTSLEMKILQEFNSGQCELVWRGNNKEVAYVCSLDKYMRKRWNLAWILCLTLLCCALFVLLLKRKRVKQWLKKMATDKPHDDVFQKRRVLILYSPDYPSYGSLVNALATSLQELSLTVMLDQWHRIQMCELGAISWFHQERSRIYKENGIIILLFSEGGKQIFNDGAHQNSQHRFRQDPYSTFGSILNCVCPDFQEGEAPGHYVVASFDLLPTDIPQIFHSVPVLSLPSQLTHLLKELAGKNKNKLGKNQLHRLSTNVSRNLQRSINEWQRNSQSPSISEHSDSHMLMPSTPNRSLSVEMHPLI
eukprot:XP_012817156.1 PREDICTED: interleukin-17 receptor C isoform X2 [Xenopus tropicalis]